MVQERMMDNEEKMIGVSWYNCACEVGSKYCDEYHKSRALVPESILSRYEQRARNDES